MTSLPGKFRSLDDTWRHFLPVTASSCKLQPCRKWNIQYTSFQPSTAYSRWLPVKWRHFWFTFGHLRSCDIISSHVTSSCCELQPCRKWNVQYTWVFCLLQPLPDGFWSNDITSGSFPVTREHVMSFYATWLPSTASYSLVRSEIYSIREFSAFYIPFRWLSDKWRHFWVTSCHQRSRDVISCYVTSFPVTWRLLLWATALQEVKCTVHAGFRLYTATSRWLTVKWHHLRVTSSQLRSRDVISCHVTASYCELQHCRKWNVQHTRVFGFRQPLPGDFRSNDVTSGHVGLLRWFPVTWVPPPASYSPVGAQTYPKPAL